MSTHNDSSEDPFFSALKRLRTEYSGVLTQNAQLKAELHDVQRENTDLKLELKETRALLGKAVVSASKQPNAVAGPSKRAVSRSPRPAAAAAATGQTGQKRARSLSVEIIEQPAKKKVETQKSQSQVFSTSANEKPHQRLYPTPSTPSSGDAKRRRIDSKQKSPTSSLLSRSSSTFRVTVPNRESKPKNLPNHEGKIRVPDSIMKAHLPSSPPLPISPPPLLDLLVPRKFLRLVYGGSDQHFLQYIPATKNPSGPTKRNVVFPMLDMNPTMPIQPGHAGLVFASRHEILTNGPWTVFCKPPETGKALWLYLGEYTNVLCGKMTKEEFGIQRDVVKKEWAKMLLRTKQVDVYVSMRARIALRKAGVLPVDDAKEEDMLVKAEMDKVKGNKGTQVMEDDIIQALDRGDEGIDIIRMTCVKYDQIFAENMKLRFLEYPKMLLAEKKRKQSGGGGDVDEDVDEVPVRRARRKTCKGQVCEDPEESLVDSDSDDEDEDDDDTTYQP